MQCCYFSNKTEELQFMECSQGRRGTGLREKSLEMEFVPGRCRTTLEKLVKKVNKAAGFIFSAKV